MEKRKTNIIKLFEDAKAESKYLKISAPMVRYSKLEFRQLLRKYGTDLCFTPMIIADSFCRSEECRNNEFKTSQYDTPLVTQFAAKNSSEFVTATQLVYAYSDGIDLNCGCPQNWAIKKGYGCSLLKNPQILFQIIRELYNSLPEMHQFSCSYKIRLLENQEIRKTIDLCRQLESCGLSFLTIHGRTAWQKYTDPCNYEAIADIKKSTKIPIVYNGDIKTYEDLSLAYHRTKCDGIMVARALLTNPMLFDEKKEALYKTEEKNTTCNDPKLEANFKDQTTDVMECVEKSSKTNTEIVLDQSLKLTKFNFEKLYLGKSSKTGTYVNDLKSITGCIMEWITLNLNAKKQEYQTFHHHLIFMLEKYLSKLERLQFNKLKHKNQVYNFLNNKFELNIKLVDSIQSDVEYTNKSNSILQSFQRNPILLLNYDNSLIENYKLGLSIQQTNSKNNSKVNKYVDSSQSEGKYFENFTLDVTKNEHVNISNKFNNTEDINENEFYFINQTIFDI